MIPYENGWSLTVDGEETELVRGDIGFLACKVASGDHDIVLKFTAPGLYVGAAGSVIFWILFAGSRIIIVYRKRRYEKRQGQR